MASGIVHDFNNMLMVILGYSELLLRGDWIHQDQARNFLQIINVAARDAATIVGRLREFYRLREDTDAFYLLDLNDVIRQTVSLTKPKWQAQPQAEGRMIQVQMDLAPAAPTNGDEAALREMLTNLIFNAVDAMPSGGTLTLRTHRGAEHVVLEVEDTGIGMSEEVRQHCMEPWFTTKGEKGTGLGLAVVYGIIRRHDGTIDIDSEVGRGSRFIIHLLAQTGPGRLEGVAAPSSSWRPLRVLLIDDDPEVRRVITEYLTGDGHTVETAANGREGLQRFMVGRFDLVISDLAMPEMSGNQMADIIRQIAPQTPIIHLSGFDDLSREVVEPAGSGRLYLRKPVTLEELRRAIAQVIASRE